MGRHTSFAHQKDLLGRFSVLLSDFDRELQSLYERYEQGLVSLHEDEGLMDEIYQDYRDHYLPSHRDALSGLSNGILSDALPFIEKEIDFLSSRG